MSLKREGEIEARHLLLVGAKESAVAEITGLNQKFVHKLWEDIESYEAPYTIAEASEILGMSYRTVYFQIHNGSVKAKKLDTVSPEASYEITRQHLVGAAEARLQYDGERRAAYLLFVGKPKHIAAIRGRMAERQIDRLAKELEQAGVGPDSTGPYTSSQVGLVLGLHGRQIRNYCEAGRIRGLKIGYQWTITREEIIAFGGKDRRAGAPVAAKSA